MKKQNNMHPKHKKNTNKHEKLALVRTNIKLQIPGLVAFYNIRSVNIARLFIQPRSLSLARA